MRDINPSSVNTIRVATARDSQGKVHILGASLRAGGKGNVVDNFHAGGEQYFIDVETGVVSHAGSTFAGEKGICFSPSTGKKMIGLEIPHCNTVVETVKAAAKNPSI